MMIQIIGRLQLTRKDTPSPAYTHRAAKRHAEPIAGAPKTLNPTFTRLTGNETEANLS
ncbi:MAG: hypothetical protein GY748_04890 [Planctomycetaceae bacterium]|nr:hypothetical protein [Planctomycetaceae bacterium]